MDKKNITESAWNDNQLKELSIMKEKLKEKLSSSSLDISQINNIIKLIDSNENKSNNVSFEDYSKWKKILKQTDYEDKLVYELEDNWQLFICVVMKNSTKIIDLKFSPNNIFTAPAFKAIKYFPKVFYINSSWVSTFKSLDLDIESDTHSINTYQLKVFSDNKNNINPKQNIDDYLQWKKIKEKQSFGKVDVYTLDEWWKIILCFLLNDAISIQWVEQTRIYWVMWFDSDYSIEYVDFNWINSVVSIQSQPIKESDELVFFTK